MLSSSPQFFPKFLNLFALKQLQKILGTCFGFCSIWTSLICSYLFCVQSRFEVCFIRKDIFFSVFLRPIIIRFCPFKSFIFDCSCQKMFLFFCGFLADHSISNSGLLTVESDMNTADCTISAARTMLLFLGFVMLFLCNIASSFSDVFISLHNFPFSKLYCEPIDRGGLLKMRATQVR